MYLLLSEQEQKQMKVRMLNNNWKYVMG